MQFKEVLPLCEERLLEDGVEDGHGQVTLFGDKVVSLDEKTTKKSSKGDTTCPCCFHSQSSLLSVLPDF